MGGIGDPHTMQADGWMTQVAITPTQRYRTGGELTAELAEVFQSLSRPFTELTEAEQINILGGLKFFVDFAEPEVAEVLQAGEVRQIPSGQEIVQEGLKSHSFYILIAGEVMVAKSGRVIAQLDRGDSFGEMGYLADVERSASVIAKTPVTVLRISAAVKEWASFPCQLRMTKAFQRTLIERLAKTSGELSKHVG